jgi:hypothetical protein
VNKKILYQHANELFRRIFYDGPEATECAQQLCMLDPEESRVQRLKDEDELIIGLRLVEINPERSYDYLRKHKEYPEVKQAMKKLSPLLEESGNIGKAYKAGMLSESPDEERLDRLRRRIIDEDKKRSWIYLPFELSDDIRAREMFYEMRQDYMEPEDKYRFALETSRKTDDKKWRNRVQELRRQFIEKDLVDARAIFYRDDDQEGLDMVQAKLKEQAPGLEGHEDVMRRVLRLNAEEKIRY